MHTDETTTGDDFDPAAAVDRILAFLRESTAAAGADGVIIPLDGGLNSTVTAVLAVDALGSKRVSGLVMPCNKLGAYHARDAEGIATALGIEYDLIHLQPLFAQFGGIAPDRFELHDRPELVGNAIARLRMAVTYLAANATARLVCGTVTRSERLMGHLTKHGDGAADLLPLGQVYKTDVPSLAAELDVPPFVRERSLAGGLFAGPWDGPAVDYETVDPVLRLGVDEGLDASSVAARVAVAQSTVEQLLSRHQETAHKRRVPAMPARGP